MRRAFERSLLCGVSLVALSLASGFGHARSLTPGGDAVAPTLAAQQAAIQAAQQAAGAAGQAEASLARAAAALAAARKLQSDAAAAARAAGSSVPNGLVTGGLMPSGGTSSDPLAGIKADASKWVGANAPVQTNAKDANGGTKVTVDIQQTQQKSILYWDTFNVGANTTVNFKQASSDWIALNRIQDPSAAPSRILGQINALGGVYLINRNGIVFGAGSQVNVHTLIASSLDVGVLGSDLATRDQYFLNTGVANLNSFSIYDKDGGAATNLIAGDVTLERGASITANITSDVVKLGSGGSVYLFGANVHNSGSITTPTGEVAMIAARTIDVIPNGYSALPSSVLGKDDAGKDIKFRGTEFKISQFSSLYFTDADSDHGLGYPRVNNYLAGTGAVTHDGLIDASRGIVVMNGDTVKLDNPRDASGRALTDSAGHLIQGVISVDTSIDRNSFVLLRAATSVSMNGVISSQPLDDGAAGLTSTQSFTPAYIEATAQTSVSVGSNGLISAPSAEVVLNAKVISDLFLQGVSSTNTGGNRNGVISNSKDAQSVLLAPGATIDVAGLQNVELPASYNVISFQPRAEFADMPLQRSGALYGQTLWIDIRNTGTRSDGTTWVGTPLADASGYVAKVPRSIYQLMTVGGSISLGTDLTTNNGASNVKTEGSVMNVAGGSVKFLPGMVNTTRLLGSDGRIYNIANADPNMTYLGIAGQFTVNHAHWGVTETWSTTSQIYSPGFTEGHDAGRVSVVTVNPSLLGTMYFGSTAGERQITGGQLPLQGTLELTTPSSVQIGATASANYTTQSGYTTQLSDDILSSYGLSSLSITANDFVLAGGSTLNLAAGGGLSVKAGAIDIAGTISAAGGSVDLVADRVSLSGGSSLGSLFKAPKDASGNVMAANVFVGGTIDVSGRFVNDIGRVAGVDATGPAFINGGTISIATSMDSASVTGGGYVDTTGSILLAQGSVLDVSSGGYISPQGKAKTVGNGVMAGQAGGISLALYSHGQWEDTQGPHHPTTGVATPAVIKLDGALRGYGFESNGSLRIAGANTIRIGGAASTLPTSLLTGGGFGSYTIESVTDQWSGATANIIVSAGTELTLQQRNFVSLADYTATPTGTKLGQQATPQLALLPDNQRKAVDLTLKADNITLDTGSKIVTDPKARITLAAVVGNRNGLKPTEAAWTVAAKSVELRGTIIDHGGSVFINSAATHLSSDAKVDLSGTFVANSLFGTANGPATSGTYIAGGTFTVEAGQLALVQNQTYYAYSAPSGYLVADAGALVDVSGAAGNIQVANARGVTSSVWSWSDAGTVSADVTGFAWGGSFAAAGGRYVAGDGSVKSDSRANGGTVLLGGGGMLLRQDTSDVVAALAAYNGSLATAPGALVVAADQLAPFDNVYLYAASAQGGAARIYTDRPGNVYGETAPSWATLSISGPLNWTVTNRLEIAAGVISAPTSAPVDARIAAPYALLAGNGSAPVAGTSTLTVNAQTIDVQGAPTPSGAKPGDPTRGLDFSGFSQVNLIASSDIRLGTIKIADGLKTNIADTTPTAEQSSFTGNLVTKGDLLFSAQRIYPVTAVTFGIETPGNVKFTSPADSNTTIPLSAGGGITVRAATIEQAGNLFAPLGTITLGNTDSSVSSIITQSVVLAPGSLTSVSLADTTVPYGATSDGTNWYYNANLNPLSAPPSKGLILSGSTVTRSDGSTIDLRGGGDLQAMEWIQGKGGTRDVLASTSGQAVYALVPSRSDPLAAYDLHFATARSADNGATITAGDSIPLPGQQITIDGGGGIPAGTYTLYPAHYATLPGAMRVVVYASDNTGKNISTGTKPPDGTVLATGNYTQSTVPGKQSAGQTVFAVQTNSVWQQYSEYSFTGANSYYAQLAAKQNTTAPRLPMDAGRLSISALQSIVLNGMALTQPGQDSRGNIGRGGELDISAPKLAVVGHAEYVSNDVPAGYVGLDVTQLTGFESILIGGSRSDFANGTLITPTATNVVVDTRGETFSAPEILMVAKVGEWQELKQQVTVGSTSVTLDLPVYVPVDGSGTVTVKSGSVIETTGTVHAGLGRHYVVVSDGQAPVTAASLAAALGGTLSGTEILGADLTKLTGADSAALKALAYYANGGPQQPGRGAMFVASNDSSLQLTGPSKTGASAPALTIKFANVGADPVSGSLSLAGGDTSANGRVVLADGARITTNTLTLQGTASSNAVALNTTNLHASLVNLVAPSIGIGAASAVTGQSLVLPANAAQFADVQTLALRAFSGPITVYGDFNSGTRSLTLDANAIALGLDGGGVAHDARISATDTLTLTNTAGPAFGGGSAAGGNSLQFAAREIDLGSGVVNGSAPATYMTVAGYSSVGLTASDRVLVKGPGMLTLGVSNTDKVDFTVTTPSVLVAGATGTKSQSFAITGYAGNVTIQDSVARSGVADRPADSTEVGGSLQITASNITIASTVQAQGGTITLNAVAGNVELKSGAYLSAGGYKRTLVDVDTYAPGGKIVLNADIGTSFLPPVPGAGQVLVDAGSVIDVAQPAGGLGYGGEIDVNALRGGATISGILRGSGGAGLGGRFKLDTQNGVDLTSLADNLLAGGLSGAVDIHTRTGNLELLEGHTLKANVITLTADDTAWDGSDASKQFGQVVIAGTLNADGYAGNTADGTGQAGGQVGLFGRNSVVLKSTAQILARSTHADERGGDVMIGTAWSAAGKIDLQSGSLIDVSGGTKGGLSGGTVTVRAPLDGNNDVKIKGLDATIAGARAVNVQAFVTINTEGSPNNVNGIDGSQLTTKNGVKAVWDGYVDPAGSVTSNGIAPDFGTWTNVTGNPLQVTPGSYTAPPDISVLTSGGQTVAGTTYVDPQTGATYYQVTDPVTGTTFRSSLQVTSITVTNGGSYTSVPKLTLTSANGSNLPGWGTAATAKATMAFNNFDASRIDQNIGQYAGKKVNLLYIDPVTRQQTPLGSGTLTIVGGTPTVEVTSTSNTSQLPNSVFVFTSFFGGITYETGHTLTTMRVDKVTVTGGAGYSGGVNVGFSSDPVTGAVATAAATMGAALTVTSVSKGYRSTADLPQINFGGSGGGSVSYGSQTSGLTGTTDDSHNFAPNVGSIFIPMADSKVFNGAGDTAALTTIASYQAHQLLYTDVLADFVQGNGIQGVGLTGSYQFTGLLDRLKNGLVKQLGADVVHVQPGIELVNSSSTKNSGNITVASNWNLAAGVVDRGKSAPTTFNAASDYVAFTYRLANTWGGLDAGALTLRAAGNININASISDGFFQFGNYLDPGYISAVNNYILSDGTRRTIDPNGLGAYTSYLNGYATVPVAPYNTAGNSVSPTSQDLAIADLFPHRLLVCTIDCSAANVKLITAPLSWSYGLTAGADLASANPTTRVTLARAEAGINGSPTPVGNITVDKHTGYTSNNSLIQISSTGGTSTSDVTYNLPTMVRTGTGNIDISAARDVLLADTVAPGVIYAAGVNTAKLPDPNYTLNTVNGLASVVVGNTDPGAQQNLFLEPRVLTYGAEGLQFNSDLYAGPPSAAAFPERGGDVRVDAQRDIIGNANSGDKVVQYYQPWLFSATGVAGNASTWFGAGVFAPSGTQIATQTAWWIQYSSFRQGILSAGGNVTVVAGRDMKDVSVSLPTTGRVSGGLSANSVPVTHLYDSGNMIVSAGGDIRGGSFYEGSGHARITAGGSIADYGKVKKYASDKAVKFDNNPLLAVDTGQITMSAHGSISTNGVVNPAELHAQQPTLANPLDVPAAGNATNALYMTTYGPDSKARLVAEGGDLTIAISPTAVTDQSGPNNLFAAASMYPASFEALALNGDLITKGLSTVDANGAQVLIAKASFPAPGIVLSPSEHGTFELMAQGSVDLSFGYPKNSSATYDAVPRPYISAGASLIDAAFDPLQPNKGFDGSFSAALLAHQDDVALGIDTIARVYAATGDITATGSYGKRTTSDSNPGYQHIEINRPARVAAGRDIVDLNVVVQNIHTSDVSSIEAGRNIAYTGYNNGGGIQVAGPGFLVVQAGGDIGPFLPASHNNASEAPVQEGVVSVGNSTPTPVGNIYVNGRAGGSVGIYDTALLGPRDNPRRTSAVTEAAGTKQGADIITMFGTKFGINYKAVVDGYIDPANASAVPHNYISDLRAFLARIGEPSSGDDASVFAAFQALPADLQHVFVDQVFFTELKAVGIAQAAGTVSDTQRGYRMIETMFPASFGYTANTLGGGGNGASQLVKTGDMNLLHATVQTRLGGDISIFGPGGNIIVGSLAAESNTALKLRDIGILTLGGGAINTFTDQSVLVNASRVLTTQGGDILMWSSNGNLDAGRGSKTTLSAPALQVLYDQDDYQSIDLGGFVTGAGIGTLQASTAAGTSELYLLAPRGTIDFGTAGVRASGSAVFVAPVIANASNFQVQGSTSGIPTVSVPNVGALTAGSNTAGAAAKTADTPTASGASKPASIFIVEVIGYGGGDGQGEQPDDKKQCDTTSSGDCKQ
jgi:filamentous hemagglutinin family protein